MKTEADEVRSHFEGYPFGAPCSETELQHAEALLGEPLPISLREFYLAFNGFDGPARTSFLWPLFSTGYPVTGLVEFNQFLRHGDEFPHHLVSRCVFFGGDGCGPHWGIMRDLPDRVIRWDPYDGDEYGVVGHTCLEVWAAEKRRYDQITNSRNG